MDQIRRRLLIGSSSAVLGLALFNVRSFGKTATALPAAPVPVDTATVTHSDDEWRKLLTPSQYSVLRQEGTERPYSSPLNDEHRLGIFACAGCAKELFSSKTKFDSGTGWPSFYQPLDKAVGERKDNSAGMLRTEIHCSRCEGHLGHVFDDGPAPTGLRYCMNGVAMSFKPTLA